MVVVIPQKGLYQGQGPVIGVGAAMGVRIGVGVKVVEIAEYSSKWHSGGSEKTPAMGSPKTPSVHSIPLVKVE